MSNLLGLLVIIIAMAAEMTMLFTSNGGVHAPKNFGDWVCWLMAVVLAVFVAGATFSVLPMDFDLSKSVLLLLEILSVPLMVGISWGIGRLSRKYEWF